MNFAPLPTGQPRRWAIRRSEIWYDAAHDTVFVPVVTAATVATVAQQIGAQGEQLPRHEQVPTVQQWFAPEASVEPVPLLASAPATPFFAPSQDVQQELWLPPRWYDRGNDPVDGRLVAQIAAAGSLLTGDIGADSPVVWFPFFEPGDNFNGPPLVQGWGTSYDASGGLVPKVLEGTWFGPIVNNQPGLIPTAQPAIGTASGGASWFEVPFASLPAGVAAIGVGDFVVEIHLKPTASTRAIAAQFDEGGTNAGWSIAVNSSGIVTFSLNATPIAQGSIGVLGVWHEIFAKRIAGVASLWIDGAKVATAAAVQNVTNGAQLFVGKQSNASPGLGQTDWTQFAIYLSDVSPARILKHAIDALGGASWMAGIQVRPDWSEERDRRELWYAPDAPGDNPSQLASVTPPFDPTAYAGAEQQPDPTEQKDQTQTWFGDADLMGIREVAADATPPQIASEWQDFPQQQDHWLWPVWWYSTDAGEGPVPPVLTTVATVAQQAALWVDEHQQDRAIAAVWHQPQDPTETPFPPAAAVVFNPATLAGLEEMDRQQLQSQAPNWYSIDFTVEPPVAAVLVVAAGFPVILFEIDNGDILLYLGGSFVVKMS